MSGRPIDPCHCLSVHRVYFNALVVQTTDVSPSRSTFFTSSNSSLYSSFPLSVLALGDLHGSHETSQTSILVVSKSAGKCSPGLSLSLSIRRRPWHGPYGDGTVSWRRICCFARRLPEALVNSSPIHRSWQWLLQAILWGLPFPITDAPTPLESVVESSSIRFMASVSNIWISSSYISGEIGELRRPLGSLECSLEDPPQYFLRVPLQKLLWVSSKIPS